MERCGRKVEVEYRRNGQLRAHLDQDGHCSLQSGLDLVSEDLIRIGARGSSDRSGEVRSGYLRRELCAGDRDAEDELDRADDFHEVHLDCVFQNKSEKETA